MRAIVVALLLTCAVAIATGTTSLDLDEQNTLTAIDTVPTKPQLDSVFDNAQNALQKLTSIANDPDPTADIGIRLRAIHALAKYCVATPCVANDVAHQSVASVVSATATATAHDGSQVLLLRAAIETLGAMRVSGDAPTLWPLLDHPSRDIRAATARALRDLCNNQAVTPLRARYSVEMTDQVKLAISEALRILGQCSNM